MRFGILSTADIGRRAVIPAIRKTDHEVVAVASRDEETAREFADDLEIPTSYGSYEELLEADIDAVYNPLPNALHAEWTRRAADAGLDVLCEKPLTVDASAATALFDYCADAGVTLMEAFMYQFHPRTERAREIVREDLSTVRSVESTFTFSLRGDPDDIRLSPQLAGGSLMDVGCYAVSATRGFLGEPARIHAHALDTRECGVDTDLVAQFEYDDSGAHAQIRSGFDTQHRQHYCVDAENGWLEAENVFNPGPDTEVSITYSVDGEETTETFDPEDAYRLEVEAFVDAAERGSEPPIDRTETVANMRAIDAIYESADCGAPVALDGSRQR
ncbi:Gfo/Idh/MocA family oxidoreductase [Halobacteria archaeon AArc-m2/3/4]|uniref:Gfo/Idh/MocA family oxidoreductase n=1 Tax=Natronoglomus mannanivorans TaxID=2979990 RepID=A0ABT2QEL9_9EURY|nr:Gfo/Idh/MocA family oxidoreductase [Halobacteria archaeon AArc-m2/3/4]